jgi:hypothetical protein
MNELREKIFAWILKRQPARKVVMPQWNEIRRVVVLYPNGNIQHIIKQIENSDKEVVQFTLPDKKDINWLTKRPNSDVREQIMARHFDLLIDLTQQPSLTMQYMAMYIRADFKVGRFIREGIHDLTIDTPPQPAPDYLLEQIVRYINMFTQK